MTRRTYEVITHDRKTAWSATPDGTGRREGRGRGYWSNNDNGKLVGEKGGSRVEFPPTTGSGKPGNADLCRGQTDP